jgi:hypothetical protein
LPDEVKAERVKSLKGHFEEEGGGFLQWIVTGDENWVHHYDPKKKMVCGIPALKKFKTQASSGKVMLTVFQNCEGILLTDFLEKGTSVISERYIAGLKLAKNAS